MAGSLYYPRQQEHSVQPVECLHVVRSLLRQLWKDGIMADSGYEVPTLSAASASVIQDYVGGMIVRVYNESSQVLNYNNVTPVGQVEYDNGCFTLHEKPWDIADEVSRQGMLHGAAALMCYSLVRGEVDSAFTENNYRRLLREQRLEQTADIA